ncbi:MAG: ABC transporter permease [Armatimonadota bacterium]
MRFLTLVRVELEKLYRRPAPYVGYGIAAVGATLLVFAAKAVADNVGIDERIEDALSAGSDLLVGVHIAPGPFVAYAALTAPALGTLGVIFGLPMVFFLVLQYFEMLAGERRVGCLRTLLTRPISRAALVTAKMTVTGLYAVSATVLAGGASLGLALLLYGNGPVFLLNRDLLSGVLPQSLSSEAALWRLAAAYGILALGMVAAGAIGLLFSSLANNSAVAVVLTMSFILVNAILEAIPSLEWLHPYLLSHHMRGFEGLFEQPILTREVLQSVFALLVYAGIPFLAAAFVVERSDVTC